MYYENCDANCDENNISSMCINHDAIVYSKSMTGLRYNRYAYIIVDIIDIIIKKTLS